MNNTERLVVGVILASHLTLIAYSAMWQSPTLNEPGHLVAGLSHWQLGRFDLYRVNPPLVRMWAALPVLAAGCHTDWTEPMGAPGDRSEFRRGHEFIRLNGERSLWLFTMARWACLPFTVLGALTCFFWSRECYGCRAGLLALAFWCFSPNIMGHAQLITPDVPAAALTICASYLYWRWLKRPTWWNAIRAGLLLGVTLLTKSTCLLLIPFWCCQWIALSLTRPCARQGQAMPIQCTMIAAIIMLSIYVVNLGYGFEGALSPIGEFQFVSKTLGADHEAVGAIGNRFAGSWLDKIPLPLPANYVLGIDHQKKDLEHFPWPSYLRGEFRETGWWYYYLYALAIKVPIGYALLLVAIVGSTLIAWLRRNTNTHPEIDSMHRLQNIALLLPPLGFLVLVSSQTGLNHHLRYLLPAFPFAFIWISQIARLCIGRRWLMASVWFTMLFGATSSLWCYPHQVAYFNELVLGPRNGSRHLLGSNLDWGQDLLYLRRWIERHNRTQMPLYLAYYGYFGPEDVGFEYSLPPRMGAVGGNEPFHSGLYAISTSFVRGYGYRVPDGEGNVLHADQYDFSYFGHTPPIALAGYSILLYEFAEPQTPD